MSDSEKFPCPPEPITYNKTGWAEDFTFNYKGKQIKATGTSEFSWEEAYLKAIALVNETLDRMGVSERAYPRILFEDDEGFVLELQDGYLLQAQNQFPTPAPVVDIIISDSDGFIFEFNDGYLLRSQPEP